MHAPKIVTAIPKRRYRLGEFSVTILADIDSTDDAQYRYIMAVVRDGESQPGLYLTLEKSAGNEASDLNYDMRLIMQDGSQTIGSSDAWKDMESFATQALQLVTTILNLADEEIRRLL
ncbi:MAG: hypothetical protein V3R51_06255 [Gammaproteobacteria bacterium]